jgi:signal transduction histidine kinase
VRRGLRFRLALTIVALVAITATVLGVGASVAVENVLRGRLLADAEREANFDLSVLVPAALESGANRRAFEASDLPGTFRRRGNLQTLVDWGRGDQWVSAPQLSGALDALPADIRRTGDAGRNLVYAWSTVAGSPSLVVGGRPAAAKATFWFVRDTSDIEGALTTLRIALGVGALLLVLIALLAARRLARGILQPIASSAAVARRLADGDLSARVPVSGGDELGAWARSFNAMAGALEETVAQLRAAESQNRRFVSDVAHELRTPLAALVAEASLVRDGLAQGDLGPGERRAAELLVADVARLRVLVEDLMELSRFDAAAEEPRRETVDLAALVRAIASSRAPNATVETGDEPLLAETEPRRLDRIVGNLLDNAREHAPGSPVDVTISRAGDRAVIAVRDHGPGVDPSALPRLFERFWKADPSRTRGTSGLGLAIAAEHAALLGGTLAASLPAGGGLRVELKVPLGSPVARPLPGGDEAVNPEAERWVSSEQASRRPAR